MKLNPVCSQPKLAKFNQTYKSISTAQSVCLRNLSRTKGIFQKTFPKDYISIFTLLVNLLCLIELRHLSCSQNFFAYFNNFLKKNIFFSKRLNVLNFRNHRTCFYEKRNIFFTIECDVSFVKNRFVSPECKGIRILLKLNL